MNTQALLQKLKENLPEDLYSLAVQLSDREETEDRITQLTNWAENRALLHYKFDVVDWLEGKELAEYMELDNKEKRLFGMEQEWDLRFIEETKRGIDSFKKI